MKCEKIIRIGTFLIILCCFLGIKHEIRQDKEIQELRSSYEKVISDKIISQGNAFKEKCGDGFDYLAIGNSITKHGMCDYWWTESGMAATEEDKDYVHQVVLELNDKKGSINFFAYNFYAWEVQGTDRAETLQLLDSFLSPQLDLVTIQLGENASDTNTLEQDSEELIRYIAAVCPNAQIMVVGEFWEDSLKDEIKREACLNTEAVFIDLSAIWNNSEYQAGLGTTVYGSDGEEHIIDHEGVARHPNDKAMRYIAEQIIKEVK